MKVYRARFNLETGVLTEDVLYKKVPRSFACSYTRWLGSDRIAEGQSAANPGAAFREMQTALDFHNDARRPWCASCPFYAKILRQSNKVCVLNPPSFVPGPGAPTWAYPPVDWFDTCSHHPDYPGYVADLKRVKIALELAIDDR